MHLRAHAREAMERTRLDVVAETQQAAPKKSGALVQGIVATPVQETTTGLAFEIVASAPYSEMVDKGVKAHVIMPRNATVLSWVGDGRRVFCTRVDHPGFEGRHFFSEPMPRRFNFFLSESLAVAA